MLWASESRNADFVGTYGPRRGNRTVQSVPIPRHPTGLPLFRFASGNGSPLEPCHAQIDGLPPATSCAPVLRRIIRPVDLRLRPAGDRSEGSSRTPV